MRGLYNYNGGRRVLTRRLVAGSISARTGHLDTVVPIITCVRPAIRIIGGHDRRCRTRLSFPIDGTIVRPRFVGGRGRLVGVRTVFSGVRGSGGLAMAKVDVRKFTSPRNPLGFGRRLSRGHTRTLGGCLAAGRGIPNGLCGMAFNNRG